MTNKQKAHAVRYFTGMLWSSVAAALYMLTSEITIIIGWILGTFIGYFGLKIFLDGEPQTHWVIPVIAYFFCIAFLAAFLVEMPTQQQQSISETLRSIVVTGIGGFVLWGLPTSAITLLLPMPKKIDTVSPADIEKAGEA